MIKGLDHSVGLINDDIKLNECEYLKCVPEYFRNKNKNKNKSNQLLFIVILIILLIYFILIYNMKYI